MTRREMLLLKLMEECAEVSQRASKQILYGKDEIQDGQSFTNAERTAGEIEDLFVICKMLDEENELPDSILGDLDRLETKKAKVEKWLKFALEVNPT